MSGGKMRMKHDDLVCMYCKNRIDADLIYNGQYKLELYCSCCDKELEEEELLKR
jgi:hypothetical protein